MKTILHSSLIASMALVLLCVGVVHASDYAASASVVASNGITIKQGNWWEQPGSLIPESEWAGYVGRPSAFGASRPDPARMPLLTKQPAARRAAAKPSAPKVVATAPPVDPCAEKVWQAFDDAAKQGKIPAAAVPAKPVPGQPAAVAPPLPAGKPEKPEEPKATTPAPQAKAPESSDGGIYSSTSSSTAAPGTSAHGRAAPNLGTPPQVPDVPAPRI